MLFEVKLQFVRSFLQLYIMVGKYAYEHHLSAESWFCHLVEFHHRQISVPYGVGLFMLGFYLYKNCMPTSLSFLVKNIVQPHKQMKLRFEGYIIRKF